MVKIMNVLDNGAKSVTLVDEKNNITIVETVLNSNNKVEIIGSTQATNQLKIIFSGNNAYVRLGNNLNFRGTIRVDNGGTVLIGDNFNSTNNISLLCRKDKTISIGKDCLFATSIIIRTSDEHSIFSLDNNELLNPNKDVEIGNKVWLCDNVLILKGSQIGEGTIVGAGSTVASKVESNVLVAGNPAMIKKRNVYWTVDKPL